MIIVLQNVIVNFFYIYTVSNREKINKENDNDVENRFTLLISTEDADN